MQERNFLAELIEGLASPAKAGELRGRLKAALLKAATQRSVSETLDKHLEKLDEALKALRMGELIDEMIAEIRPGGVARIAELYGEKAARVSGWREKAPEGVDARSLLMAAWLHELITPEKDQADQRKLLAIQAASVPVLGGVVRPSSVSILSKLTRLHDIKDDIPMRGAMRVQGDDLLDFGDKAVLPKPCMTSSIVFVGEAPGRAEVIADEPFAGPAGQLLNDTIDNAWGKTFKTDTRFAGDYGVTNVFLTAPHTGKVSAFFGPARSKETLQGIPAFTFGRLLPSYLPSLIANARYLAEAKPLVLVALGATAAWALLGRYTNMRGQVVDVDYGPFKAKVLTTYNPGYVIRDGNRKRDFEDDIRKATNLLVEEQDRIAGHVRKAPQEEIHNLHQTVKRRQALEDQKR